MKKILISLVMGLSGVFVSTLFAETTPIVFHASVLWENDLDKGVLLVSPTEMFVIDSKAQKLAKVTSQEAIKRAYLSPDTRKLAYTTASGVWFVKLETGEVSKIATGDCNFLRWDLTSASLMFSIDYYENLTQGATKLFWVDGDGENLKQVYP